MQDLELIRLGRFLVEAPTERESECIRKVEIEPTDYAVYSTKLEMACREASDTMQKLGVSDLIIAGDIGMGYYTQNGDLALAEMGTWIHIVDSVIPIKYILKHYKNDPTVGVNDGDVFFVNEALYGGIHNPDMIVIVPVFSGDEIICWLSAGAHEPETGAIEPGGMPQMARNRYDEGFKSPPIKIGEKFRLKKDLIELIENNVRYPFMLTNDTAAKLTACLKMREKVLEVVQEKGNDFVIALLRKLIIESEKAARRKIENLYDGTYRSVGFGDVIGFDDGLVKFSCSLIKKKDRLLFDFQGTSPRNPGSWNAFLHQTLAHLATSLFQFVFSDLPCSGGILLPIEVRVPQASILDAAPHWDASTVNNVLLLPVAINTTANPCLFKAIYPRKELRKSISVPLNGGSPTFSFAGLNQWNDYIANDDLTVSNATALGARTDMDGLDAGGFWQKGLSLMVDTEQWESTYPLLEIFRNYGVDQAGMGKYRGGTGVVKLQVVHDTKSLAIVPRGHGSRFPTPAPMYGGYADRTAPFVIAKGLAGFLAAKGAGFPRNEAELIETQGIKTSLNVRSTSHSDLISVEEGDGILTMAKGSSGYGDPLERSPELVLNDLRLEKISLWTVENIYRVAVDEDGLSFDAEKTEGLRKAARAERLRKSKTYEEFEASWLKKSPPPEATKYL